MKAPKPSYSSLACTLSELPSQVDIFRARRGFSRRFVHDQTSQRVYLSIIKVALDGLWVPWSNISPDYGLS